MRSRTGLLVLVGLCGVLMVPATGVQAATVAPGLLAYEKTDGSIVTARSDGSGAVRRIVGAAMPLVSPDGRRIAFQRECAPGHTALWVASADGSGQRLLVRDVTGSSWSPDGQRLAGRNGTSVVLVTVATGAVTAVPGSAGDYGPQWSPDGTLVAAWSGGTYQHPGQALFRPDGSSRVVRPDMPTGPWSPDGTRYLFVDPPGGGLLAVNVLTGVRESMLFLRESYDYPGAAWGPSGGAYLGVNSWVPYLPGSVDIYLVGSSDQPDQKVAANAMFPSFGGTPRPADTNGPPPAVSGLAAATSPSTVHLSWQPAGVSDYAGVEVRYALGHAAPATLQDGLDGGRLLTPTRDLGPLPPDRWIAVSVFSRDWYGNVGGRATVVVRTPHQTQSVLTAHAAPRDLVYGGRSVISGTLTRAFDAAPIADAPLTVSTRTYGTDGPFTLRGTVRTGPDGAYSFMQIPAIGYDYQIGYAGDARRAGATATTTIRVARRVTDTLDRSSASAGTPVHLTAATRPALVDGKTYLQVWCGDHPCTLGPHNTDARGIVVYTVPAPARGTAKRYRVLVPGVGGYIDGYGGWVTITGK
jgi:hypothetical protein